MYQLNLAASITVILSPHLPLLDLTVIRRAHPKRRGILQNSRAAAELLDLGPLHQITGNADHVAVGSIERQIPQIALERTFDNIQ